MSFASPSFLVFFAVVFLLARSPIGWTVRKAVLLVASYAFYAAWNPPFVALLWISTVVDFEAGRRLAVQQDGAGRRVWLGVSLTLNLGMLGFFKYGRFLSESLAAVYEPFVAGTPQTEPSFFESIVLPVGISFYTFQTLSYTLDIYFRKMQPTRSLLDFALYVAFFPQLVAGPIVRAERFLPQCEQPRRASDSQLAWAAVLFVWGLFLKVVVADGIMAEVVEQAFAPTAAAGFGDVVVGTAAFASQIYGDFAGYSLCAIATALALGFSLPDNFRGPYGAIGFSDFWRRWHVSLSSWIRDYLYIPLGGNRRGPRRTFINLMLTMTIAGLWHGAAWQFVLWGALHGLLLCLERLLVRSRPIKPDDPTADWATTAASPWRLATWVGSAATFAAVCVTWIPFRAESLDQTLHYYRLLLRPSGSLSLVEPVDAALAVGVTGLLFLFQTATRRCTLESSLGRLPWPLLAVLVAGLLAMMLLTGGEDRSFLYFQF